MSNLATRLREAREAKGLTQEALAKLVGPKKRQSLIGNLEAGAYPGSPWLPEIAYALGVHAMWLKNGIGPKNIYPQQPGQPGQENLLPNPPENVKQLPIENPLRRELLSIVDRMSDRGISILIYEAEKIDRAYPKTQKNHSN